MKGSKSKSILPGDAMEGAIRREAARARGRKIDPVKCKSGDGKRKGTERLEATATIRRLADPD